ncbi:MAG: hypothetical protein AAFY72_16430 [Cyanobacteria bacterium J06649_4]
MKPSHHAEFTPSAPTNYAPSVPMSVYRELAAELRANKAVIDSLNSRNQQLIQQNQRLKQEIHNVVQAALNLGQAAGVARQTGQDSFPSAIAPDTLAKLVRAQSETQNTAQTAPIQDIPQPYTQPGVNRAAAPQNPALYEAVPTQQAVQKRKQKAVSSAPHNRVPSPIQPTQPKAKKAQAKPKRQAAKPVRAVAGNPAANKQRAGLLTIPGTQPAPTKLFTEQSGEYRSSALESGEDKEIGGIWLALSIILIIVTAFGAGFLIMKPLLNDR